MDSRTFDRSKKDQLKAASLMEEPGPYLAIFANQRAKLLYLQCSPEAYEMTPDEARAVAQDLIREADKLEGK